MKAPSGSQWIHEIKYDGYRIQLRIDGDDRRAYTRNGYNWVGRFSRIAGAFDIEGRAIVDGEVVVIHEGRTNFSELQADLGRGDQDRLIYFAFDLLWLDGRDLRKEPQLERKRLLKELMEEHGIADPQQAAEILLQNIKTQILKGQSRTLMLSNRAIAAFAESCMMLRADPAGRPRAPAHDNYVRSRSFASSLITGGVWPSSIF
jgi:ATP-dependent DNA ligase